jgi:hypothetical protein
MEMLTLQEFMVFTKAWEYVIAIAFFAAFVVFWQVLNRGQSKN